MNKCLVNLSLFSLLLLGASAQAHHYRGDYDRGYCPDYPRYDGGYYGYGRGSYSYGNYSYRYPDRHYGHKRRYDDRGYYRDYDHDSDSDSDSY